MSNDHNQYQRDEENICYMYTGESKEVMRITRDGIYVADGVSVDEATQAVLDALSGEIQRLVNVARADDADEIERLRKTVDFQKAAWTKDHEQLAECERERDKAFTVMVAAAEEIHTHWDAHCDAEGYGPSNLMHRLENGIATLYPSYTAGAFSEMQKQLAAVTAERDELVDALRVLVDRIEYYSSIGEEGRTTIEQWEYTEGSSDMSKARAALAKVGAGKGE